MTPSLQAPAVLDVVPRMRDIERRLRDCMARGEQPAPAVLADALHEAGGALLLIVEAEERITAAEEAAGRREARYMDAEVRLNSLLAATEAHARSASPGLLRRLALWMGRLLQRALG